LSTVIFDNYGLFIFWGGETGDASLMPNTCSGRVGDQERGSEDQEDRETRREDLKTRREDLKTRRTGRPGGPGDQEDRETRRTVYKLLR